MSKAPALPQWWISVGILCVTWRIMWANRMPIMDCDEVYNYWEPLHFLHFGTGMQTWEYAPQFALRTYAYLVPMLGLSHFYSYLSTARTQLAPLLVGYPITSSKLWTFCCLRSTLAGLTAIAEINFCKALLESTKSAPIALWTYILLISSAGMTHAAGAYLPSSTLMLLFLASSAAWLRRKHIHTMAYAVLATLAIGWPFGALLFVPMGLHVLTDAVVVTKTLPSLLAATVVWTLGVQGIVMTEDYKHYGRWVSPIYEIFWYNAQGGGDELYGVEPISYYVKNLLLNFNYVVVLALLYPMFTMSRLAPELSSSKSSSLSIRTQRQQKLNNITLRVMMAPLFLWLVVVMPRPHKEERFMYPIYPLLCLGAAVTLDRMWDLVATAAPVLTRTNNKTNSSSYLKMKLVCGVILLSPSCLLSASRSMALAKYYAAPLELYARLSTLAAVQQDKIKQNEGILNANSSDKPLREKIVCTCGEWYRYPSTYYLPPGYVLGFLPSSFEGQLPQPFTKFGSKPESVSVQKGNFNDQNILESDRYVLSVSECSFIVELIVADKKNGDVAKKRNGTKNKIEHTDLPECLQYIMEDNRKNKKNEKWSKVAEYPYLDASRTSTLDRTLYLPGWHERGIEAGRVHYNAYALYEQNISKRSK